MNYNLDKIKWASLLLVASLNLNSSCQSDKKDLFVPPPTSDKVDATFYMTSPASAVLFSKMATQLPVSTNTNLATIEVDSDQTYQQMDGFGFSLTGGSAYHLANMSANQRLALLNELFAYDDNNIGVSYLRVSLGASDLDAAPFSYCDLPAGETDVNMEKFSIDPDRTFLIPMLKEILSINPQIKIMASPWSPPTWMKTNGSSKGGSLKPVYYDAYALYFVKYIKAMAAEGITIDAITVQNEPLHPGNNPSMLMPATEQAAFIKSSLGPLFKQNGITTKIIIYDHNADRTDYPISVLNDPDAKQYIDGSAFHLYGGSINDLSLVNAAHPDKNLYFTEQWVGAPGDLPNDLVWHTSELVIGATRNWCKTVLEWNLASNSNLEPHTDGGCTQCLGALTIDGNTVKRNSAYYIIAHAAKYVRPGSVRVDSNTPGSLKNVCFKTPEGKLVAVVLNSASEAQTFNLKSGETMFSATLPAGAVGTMCW